MDHQWRGSHMIPAQLDITYGKFAAVVPGSTTFDSGSGTYTVPNYDTLTIEVWGGGAPGGTTITPDGNGSGVAGTILANGGGRPTSNANGGTGGPGGTASGGNTTNTTGSAGTGASPTNFGAGTSGAGGAGANGGAGGAAKGTGTNPNNGNPGTAPGGGGGGQNFQGDGGLFSKYPGGGGGGYAKSVYVRGVTSGAPLIGSGLSYSVGAVSSAANQGDGAAGRVKFTVA